MHVFEVLGDPVRRRIMEILADGERSAGEVSGVVQQEFGISQPGVSQHLRVLRDNGFATVRAVGTRRLYAVNPTPLEEADLWLNRYRRFWAQNLDALGDEIAREIRERPDGRTDETGSSPDAVPVSIDSTQGAFMSETTAGPDQTHREVGQRRIGAGDARTILMRRRYEAPIAAVWAACTEPERISRFFVRPTGDLREGGTFSIEGNASGDIVRCEPPHRLSLTWVYADRPVDEVEIRLSPTDDGATIFELEHASILRTVTLDDGREVDVILNDPISGIWGMGTGWELGVIALGAYLRGELPDEPANPENMPEIMGMVDDCGRGWAAAVAAADASTGDQPGGR